MKKIIAAILLLGVATAMFASRDIIPIPQSVVYGNSPFTLKKNATIAYSSADLKPAADYLQQAVERLTGLRLATKLAAKGDIVLAIQPTDDYYTLNVSKRGIKTVAPTYEGIVCAIGTIRQLIDGNRVQAVSIVDNPQFSWRGFHLDCSRHFFTKQEVKEVIDLMAMYKLNRFHWHLTDDQGWRVEIKKYPKLTDEGAWRMLNNQDSVCLRMAETENNPDMLLPKDRMRKMTDANGNTVEKYGGYYTQQDLREVVAYAKQRGIEVVPEIDMPGHMLAAIDCYDGISCFKQTGWGKVFTSPLCPGKEKTLQFCKNIWDEVCELFPYEYVHIGGDEVEKDNWKACADCQKRIKDNNLKNEEELQSWFIHEMERYLNGKGKKMIGWDEITEGGLSETSTIMWWRTWAPTAISDATAHGNDVIYTPVSPLYLSAKAEPNSIEQIYNYELLPSTLTKEQQSHVLGVQANLWGEWIPSRNRMMYMYFPRILALAELAWSKPENRNFKDFYNRLTSHFAMLHRLGVPYRTPSLEGFYNVNAFSQSGTLSVTTKDPYVEIRYTTDGTFPNINSPLYTEPITVDETTHFILRPFSPDGRADEMVQADFIKQGLLEPVALPKDIVPGLNVSWYDYKGATCREIISATLNGTYVVDDVVIPKEAHGNIGLVISGYINVPEDGIYTFALMSDDGSWLKIDGNMVVDNDREQSPHEMICQQALRKGMHKMEVRYFDHNGGMLRMHVYAPDGTQLAPADIYFCK
ncbi:MAG: family 20 glycosylhydrolase [Prevotella sp.]|nr:family 20 glycosylhydrolase [Prevotella sp.]